MDTWVTLGSPLGDETAKRYLKGASLKGERRFPDNVKNWINVSAVDDYISHDNKVKDDFAGMLQGAKLELLEDRMMYNLAVRNGASNPHSSLGYLISPTVSEIVADWL